jgi:hypothetical protein
VFRKAFVATFGVGCALVVGFILLTVIAGAIASNAVRQVTTVATIAPTARGLTIQASRNPLTISLASSQPGTTWVVVKQ